MKRKLLVGTGLMIGAAIITVSSIPHKAQGTFDVNGLNTQVQNQQSKLDNHEARITNNTNDIQGLQQATGTKPSANNTTPPAVVYNTPAAPAPAPAAAPSNDTITYSNGGNAPQGTSNYGVTPTQAEIESWLEAIAPKGQKQLEKRTDCKQHFTDRGMQADGQNVCSDANLWNYAGY